MTWRFWRRTEDPERAARDQAARVRQEQLLAAEAMDRSLRHRLRALDARDAALEARLFARTRGQV